MKKLICYLVISFTCFGAMSFAVPARAIGPLLSDSLIQEVSCQDASGATKDGTKCNYSLNSFVKLGVNLADIILGIVGSLTLLMFIYGGIMLLTSAGNTERVSKGKEIILGAIVGLLIVFGSYTLIDFLINRVFQASTPFTGSVQGTGLKQGLPTDCTKHAPPGSCVASGDCKGSVIGTKQCDASKQICCIPLGCLEMNLGYTCSLLTCPSPIYHDMNLNCANGNRCCKLDINNTQN